MKTKKRYFNIINIIYKILFFFINIFSPVIDKIESSRLKKYSNFALKHQPIFIIGAPRTGSTILYQTVTNQLDVLYIDNLTCFFNKNIFFGFFLSNLLFKQKAHNCFISNLGNTKGLHSPSECGNFWYRWLPKNQHFVKKGECSKKIIEKIRSEITAVINYYDKPLVIGNNNNAMRIGFLNEIFPNAKYIVTDRNPLFTSQSLLLARKAVFNDYSKWWSVKPKNFELLLKQTFIEQVVNQIYYINQQTEQDLKTYINSANWIKINYSEFCDKKSTIMDRIKKLINFSKEKLIYESVDFIESKKIVLEEEIIFKIKDEINKKNWDDYSS